MSDNLGMSSTATRAAARHMVTTPSSSIEVVTQGAGPLVVLIPSLGRGAEDFDENTLPTPPGASLSPGRS